MVGELSVSMFRRLRAIRSHDPDENELTPSSTRSSIHDRKGHVPLIASPLDPKATELMKNKPKASTFTLKRRNTVAQQEVSRLSGGLFRKQEAASPLELFFDLFFVANLAIFGETASQATGKDIGNYIGFFSLMWSYWFHVSIHDVRFYVDSILNRFLKLAQFAIFVAFTGLGSIYRVLDDGGTTRAFHGMALVFMLSRLIFMIQYGVVLWFVRDFKKTLIPLALMMLIYLCSAMAYLGTFVSAIDHDLNDVEGARRLWVWYIFIAVEAILVIMVSSIWRILSFKRTHMVERVGLLTLIIIGEGIIGLIKAITNILEGTEIDIWAASGRVISGVFLLYLIFVLYFKPIAHDRFGTVRQQIWALLHWPLHVAILLTVEGSGELLLWTTIYNARTRLIDALPSLAEPSQGYATISDLVSKINNTMTSTSSLFTYLTLEDIFDWAPEVEAIQNLTESVPYASSEFNEQASEILSTIVNGTTNFFFQNFQFKGPKDIAEIEDPNEQLHAYFESITVIFTLFYVSAGSLLLVLAAMYWVGKNNKTWEEWLAILVRCVVGTAVALITIAAYTEPWETGYMFKESGMLVTTALLCWLAVTIFENIMENIWDKRSASKVSKGELDPQDLEAIRKSRYNGIFGPQASNESSTVVNGDLSEKPDKNNKSVNFQEASQSSSRSPSDSNVDQNRGQDEHDSLVANDTNAISNTTNDHPTQPSQTQPYPQHLSPYNLPPTAAVTSSYGQLTTNTGQRDQISSPADLERGGMDAHHNDTSFDQERVMGPDGWTTQALRPPVDGYVRPEEREG